MRLLAFDTSSDACSVALMAGETVQERHVVQPREHTRLLLPTIRELLHTAGMASSDLDGIVSGNGPGSFIGLRIAAAVAQGLSHAGNTPLYPVSSLAAIALRALREHGASEVLVTQDAHMNEVYLGRFRADGDGIVAAAPVVLHAAGAIAAILPGSVAAGAGWTRYPALRAANEAALAAILDLPHPRASDLLLLGVAAVREAAAVAPAALAPAYVRERVARPAGKHS